MEREDRNSRKLDRLEQVLRAVHGQEQELPPLRVEAMMARVRTARSGGDSRFLVRFLSAAAVAAVLLVAVTVWSGTDPEAVTVSQAVDSPWTVLVTPSVLD